MTSTPATSGPTFLALADQDDLLGTVRREDLVDAFSFLSTTIRAFGPDDVASFLNRSIPDVLALATRADTLLALLGGDE